MKIKIERFIEGMGMNSNRYIKVRIFNENDEQICPFTYSSDDFYINIEDLSSEKFLKDHAIDYYIDVDTKEIVPIGIIDFNRLNKYECFGIRINGIGKAYEAQKNVDNVILAIKEKYKVFKFLEKFRLKEEEIITL